MNDLPEQIPFDADTRPSAEVIDMARAALVRNRERLNSREKRVAALKGAYAGRLSTVDQFLAGRGDDNGPEAA